MSAPENSKDLFPPWVEAGTVTALLLPLLYTAGWSYAYHYFERFNLGLIGLDISKEYFLLYSFWTIKAGFGRFFLALAGYLIVYILVRTGLRRLKDNVRGDKWKTAVRSLPALMVPLIILSLFWLFYLFGEQAAVSEYDWQVTHDFKSYQRVQVWAKAPEAPGFGGAIKEAWSKGCYRLLMRSKDQLYLFYPVYPVGLGDKMPTDIIPFSRVEMVRILTENESCKGTTP